MDWLQTDSAIQLLKAAALVLFFAIFSGVLLWVTLRKRGEVRHWSELPLDDEPRPLAKDRRRRSSNH